MMFKWLSDFFLRIDYWFNNGKIDKDIADRMKAYDLSQTAIEGMEKPAKSDIVGCAMVQGGHVICLCATCSADKCDHMADAHTSWASMPLDAAKVAELRGKVKSCGS